MEYPKVWVVKAVHEVINTNSLKNNYDAGYIVESKYLDKEKAEAFYKALPHYENTVNKIYEREMTEEEKQRYDTKCKAEEDTKKLLEDLAKKSALDKLNDEGNPNHD